MYDQPVSTSTVIGSLESSSNPVFQDQTVVNDILTVITTDSSTEVTIATQTVTAGETVTAIPAANDLALVTIVKDAANPNAVTTISASAVKNVEAVILQGDGNVDITFNDSAAQGGPAAGGTSAGATTPGGAQRVVVTGAGAAKVTVADAKNTKISLGTGNSTVVTGHGVDTVVAGLGNSTVTGGNSDYAVVKLAGAASNYTVDATTTAGHAIVTDKVTGVTTDITKIQYVETAGSDALIFAKSTTEASIATLFETAYGHAATAADLNKYYDMAAAGATVKQIADALVAAPEFSTRNLLDDRSFIDSLYHQTFGRAGEEAGITYWLGAMHNQGATRADIVRSFAEIHTLNLTGGHGPGAGHEAILVGNVTIVSGII